MAVVIIRPSSDLRNNYNEIFRLLEEGFTAMKEGQGRPAAEVFSSLEKEFGLHEDV